MRQHGQGLRHFFSGQAAIVHRHKAQAQCLRLLLHLVRMHGRKHHAWRPHIQQCLCRRLAWLRNRAALQGLPLRLVKTRCCGNGLRRGCLLCPRLFRGSNCFCRHGRRCQGRWAGAFCSLFCSLYSSRLHFALLHAARLHGRAYQPRQAAGQQAPPRATRHFQTMHRHHASHAFCCCLIHAHTSWGWRASTSAPQVSTSAPPR